MAYPQRDLTRILLAILFISALAIAALWIVRPFVAAAVWAMTIVVVTWPSMLWLQRRLWNSRAAAVTSMLILLLLLFVVPLIVAVLTVVTNAGDIASLARSVASSHIPAPPRWVAELPLAGPRLEAAWRDMATAGAEGLIASVMPYAGRLTGWFIDRAGNLGYLLIQFALTLLLAAFTYAQGEKAAATALRLGSSLGGEYGEDLIVLAGQAIRSVALGVGLTAVIQSILAGAALALAGVPFAGVLTVAMFMLCITQIGIVVILVPAVIWVYWSGSPVAGTILLIWGTAVALLDNILRPLLVRSAALPPLLVFVGVIGGLLGFGLLGIFVGPVVLAVAYTLLTTWMRREARPSISVQPDLKRRRRKREQPPA